jgi:hypothetical protein
VKAASILRDHSRGAIPRTTEHFLSSVCKQIDLLSTTWRKAMRSLNKVWLNTMVAFACACASLSVLAADDKTPSGTVRISSKSVAIGVGVKWGDGTLDYRGAQYHFSIEGLNVVDLGISHIHATGEVFNLNDISYFTGHYLAGTAGAAVSSGSNEIIMTNDRGVVMRLHGTEKGVHLQLGGEGVVIKLSR